ncbi:MAG: hypothetical protein ACHQVS_04290 [Candidatus Babeliales bacterium]
MKNRVLLVLFTLITMAPAYGMSDLVRNAVNGTLAARLLRSTSGVKDTQRPTQDHKKKHLAKSYAKARRAK